MENYKLGLETMSCVPKTEKVCYKLKIGFPNVALFLRILLSILMIVFNFFIVMFGENILSGIHR